MKLRFTTLYILLLCFGLTACGGSSAPDVIVPPGPELPVQKVKVDPEKARLNAGLSCSDLASYISNAITDGYLNGNAYYSAQPLELVSAPETGEVSPSLDISQTNLQEAGVDEADIIKTDASGNMFIADGNRLIIASAYPATELSTRAVIVYDQNEYIEGIVLDEQRQRLMIMFHTGYSYPAFNGAASSTILPPVTIAGSRIIFIDISDFDQPVEIGELRLSGTIQETRYRNGQLVLLMHEQMLDYNQRQSSFNSNQALMALVEQYRQAVANDNTPFAGEREMEIRELVSSIVASFDISEFLPLRFDLDDNGLQTAETTLECEDVYAPELSVKLGLSMIYRIDTSGALLEGLAAVSSPSEAYFSENNVYLYQRSYDWWWSNNQADESAIHQIAYGETQLDYVGVGVIPGSINNRFSLSEHDGFLRVASNETVRGDDLEVLGRQNHLNVLKADANGVLQIVGSSDVYAEDELIYSARFIGDRGYVVTFRVIDPLFAFDLSQPTDPVLRGELEIPGFSEYIHPVGDNLLLTVGRNGDADGILPGVRFQLFDVSDLDTPTLLHSYVPIGPDGELQYSWSSASYDHHAFTYLESVNLLVIPLEIYGNGSIEENFSGFIVLQVGEGDGFTELGRIDHEDLVANSDCFVPGQFDLTNCIAWHRYSWVQPRRSVIINDSEQTVIYSLSNVGIKASSANDPGLTISSISFAEE